METKPISDFRLKLDMHTVKFQGRITLLLRILSLIISVITITSIVIYQGFHIADSTAGIIHKIIVFSLFFYVFKYFVKLFYSIKKREFIRSTLFEFITIIVLILYLAVALLPTNFYSFEPGRFSEYYLIFIQIYFFIIVLIETSKASRFLPRIHLGPPTLMMLSFLILIVVGTLLLLLPKMTTNGISFIDALFTATSASCVTGLSVFSISSTLTFKGQLVLIILVQLGGMSILTFASFFTVFFSRNNTGIQYQYMVKDLLSVNKVSESTLLLKEIIIFTFLIEILGMIFLFGYWDNTGLFSTHGEAFYYSLFHSITAFNNAGFSLWDENLMSAAIADSYYVQIVLLAIVFVGGIGFLTLSDLFNPRHIRERRKYKWKQLLPGTKIVLITTGFIILFGTIIFFFMEYNHSLEEKDGVFQKLFSSLFMVAASRTAGFNTVAVNNIALPGLLIVMLIMFIGASPGSTGGGIKTTTFFVLIKSVLATIKGKKRIEFQKKTIPFELVDKAYSIIIMSILLIILSAVALAILEPSYDLSIILFESISSFTTAGLSTGSPAEFAWGGKLVLVINMYIGRIGTLTMAFALSKRIKESKHQYPNTTFMIG